MTNTLNDGPFKVDVVQRTAAQWTATDPFIGKGDICIESDTGKIKVGVGERWTSTSYLASTTGYSGPVEIMDGSSNVYVLTVVNGRITDIEAV